jgi:protease-4
MSLDTDAMLDRRRLKRRLSLWRLAAVISVVALVAVALGRFGDLGREPHVARIDVAGIIVEDHDRLDAIEELVEDDNAKALIVRIDSPGGTTAGGESLFYALRRVAEEKPVVAVIGTLGASGGYMAALAADHIVARESSITGSIGVILQTAEISGLLDKLGITTEAIKSGPLKATPSPFEPLSDESRVATQAVVDDTHSWFVALVAERRELEQATAEGLSDGRIYTGRQALEKNLIDALGGEREAREWLAESHDISKSLPVVKVKFGEEEDLVDKFFSSLAGKTFLSERLTLDGLISLWHPDG